MDTQQFEDSARSILQSCDLATMTLKTLRMQLEEKMGVDLSDQKQYLREIMNNFMLTNEDVITYAATVEAEHTPEDSGIKQPVGAKRKGGFGAPVSLSPDLTDFLGETVLPRTEVTKRMWAYIREHNLQNPANRREILCDARMEVVFKRKKLDMFKMTKFLSNMMKSVSEINSVEDAEAKVIAESLPPDEVLNDGKNQPSKVSSSARSKKRKVGKTSKGNVSSSRAVGKKVKAAGSSSSASKQGGGAGSGKRSTSSASRMVSYMVSEELSTLLDIPRSESRCQVVSKMWEYIKTHELQNPSDRRQIILDSPLQKVFGVDQFTMFSMNKYIAQHMHHVDSAAAAAT